MDKVVLMLPLVLIVVMLVYMVARSIGRLWVQHHVKLRLLERLEEHPELYDNIHEVLEEDAEEPPSIWRQDFLVTGIMLAGLGLLCVAGSMIGSGRWAVGIYWGGVVCVALGFFLAVLGLFIRILTKPPEVRTNQH